MSEPRSDREWVDFYAEQQGVYDAFAERLEALVEALLDESDLDYRWVISFSESPDALEGELDRARRQGRSYDLPLESPVRVAGVTVGIATTAELPELADLIRREFVVDPSGSLSIEEAGARDGQIEYPFPHYLVSLDERRVELGEWSRFAGLRMRIELQTELQSAWAGIDNDLPFYAVAAYPPEVRDLLARSTQRLSEVDADLDAAKRTVWRLDEEYGASIADGDLELPVNGVSLLAYLRESELVQSLVELGLDVGLEHDPDFEPGWQTIEQRLFWLLSRDDVNTLAELEAFLKQATPRARDTLAAIARAASDQGFVPWAYPQAVVEWLWLVLRRADAETVALLRYRDEIASALNTLIGNAVPEREQHADD